MLICLFQHVVTREKKKFKRFEKWTRQLDGLLWTACLVLLPNIHYVIYEARFYTFYADLRHESTNKKLPKKNQFLINVRLASWFFHCGCDFELTVWHWNFQKSEFKRSDIELINLV